MRFDPTDYRGDYVMMCETQEDAQAFCDYMGSRGYEWGSGDPFNTFTYWSDGDNHIYYYFNEGTYGHMVPLERWTVLYASDFEFNSDYSPQESSELTLSYDSLMSGEAI